MKYFSTRGFSNNESFRSVLMEGLAPDGGLYIPKFFPKVNFDELDSWRGYSYSNLASCILQKFVDDIPINVINQIVKKTYTLNLYKNRRKDDNLTQITPLRILNKENDYSIYIQSLSNGPTLAFKDLAMQLLGNLFEYHLSEKEEELNIFGATSGDTGSAAEYAMKGKKGIRVFMLSPKNRISNFQQAQMFSLTDRNIFNISIDGVFDDCQDLVKLLSNDIRFKREKKIGTVNSINWARVVAQVIYYFYGYLLATNNCSEKVSFTVPTGNFGNIYAGHISRMMGLPISKLVVATNENDVLNEFFQTGIYRIRKSQETFYTTSPSMDISKASNFERFIYDLLNGDFDRLRILYKKIQEFGYFDLSGKKGSDGDEFLNRKSFGFYSGMSTHEDRKKTIKEIYKNYGLIIDTHTADGIKVAKQEIEKNIPMIVLETALPIKFNETIKEILGRNAECPEEFKSIENMPQFFEELPIDVERIKSYISENINNF